MNLLLNQAATLDSTTVEGNYAVNGNRQVSSCTETQDATNSWISVEIKAYYVTKVAVTTPLSRSHFFRKSRELKMLFSAGGSLKDFTIFTSRTETPNPSNSNDFKTCYQHSGTPPANRTLMIDCAFNTATMLNYLGIYVAHGGPLKRLKICQLEAYGKLKEGI